MTNTRPRKIGDTAKFILFIVPLTGAHWLLLVVTLVFYVGLTQVVKSWLLKRLWI